MLAIAAGQSSEETGAVRKPRDPTPDHPPYSWMIGEAIAALGEDGGSAEDAISGFIRGRHPGVPAAHDKFLRHYLAKHVAEGLFVCVAPGRYACRPDETELALAEVPVEKRPPATEAKRGRGRPRKDGSWPASPAGKEKVGSEPPPGTVAKRGRGRPRKDGSWPASPAGKEKVGSEPPPGTVAKRGRGRPRKDGSSPASAAGKEKVESEPPPATMAAKRGRGRPRKDGSSPASAAGKEKVESEPPPATMVAKRGRGRPRKDGSWPTPAAGKKKGGREPPSATPRRRGRSRFRALAAATGVSGEALLTVTDIEDGSEAPSTAEPRELALVVANDDGSAAPSATQDDCGEAPSAKRLFVAKEPAAFITPPPVTLDDGGGAPSAKLALVPKEPAAFSTPERSTQLAKLVPVAADESSAPAVAADEAHGIEAPWSKYKRRRRSWRSAPSKATHGSAPASIADKVADKALSTTTPKGRGRQHKSAPVTSAAGDGTPNKARSVPVKPRCQPRKLFQLTAGEVPDRLFCVLALPAPTAVATK